MRTQIAIAQSEPVMTVPLWEVATYRGLFHPSRTHYVNATSQYEAECLVAEQLECTEWFPTFSGRVAAPDFSPERLLATDAN